MSSTKHDMPSNKTFGYFFSIVFVIVAAYSFFRHNTITFLILFAVLAVITFLTTIIAAKMLYPFNWLWYRLGWVLGLVVRPIVFGILFFVIVTPVGIISRLGGRDELSLRKSKEHTYWKIRESQESDEPYGESFRNQF